MRHSVDPSRGRVYPLHAPDTVRQQRIAQIVLTPPQHDVAATRHGARIPSQYICLRFYVVWEADSLLGTQVS